MSEWTFPQKVLLILASLELLWALAGFVAEPSFQIGADAPTEKVLWVDFNGIHALSGLLLFGPALYFCRRPDWALYYVLYIAGALYITGLWPCSRNSPPTSSPSRATSTTRSSTSPPPSSSPPSRRFR